MLSILFVNLYPNRYSKNSINFVSSFWEISVYDIKPIWADQLSRYAKLKKFDWIESFSQLRIKRIPRVFMIAPIVKRGCTKSVFRVGCPNRKIFTFFRK